MSRKFTRAELEANMRMKGEGPTDADLAEMYPDLFGPGAKHDVTKKKKPSATKKPTAKKKK